MRALRQLIGVPMPKNIDEIIRESIKLRDPFQHFATVIISEKDIIKGIGQSKPNNLILDNFGEWLAGFLRQPVAADSQINLTGDDGAANIILMFHTVTTAGNRAFNWAGGPVGTRVKVGSGSTPAARSDYAIETDFVTAPEDDYFDTGAGSYAAGSVSVAGAITAGGAGTINEVVLSGTFWDETGDGPAEHILFHDILAAGEAFVLGNTITAAYTINL